MLYPCRHTPSSVANHLYQGDLQRFVSDKISEKLNLHEYWFLEFFWRMLPDRVFVEAKKRGRQGPMSRWPMSEYLRAMSMGRGLNVRGGRRRACPVGGLLENYSNKSEPSQNIRHQGANFLCGIKSPHTKKNKASIITPSGEKTALLLRPRTKRAVYSLMFPTALEFHLTQHTTRQ